MGFSPVTQAWFEASFSAPTPAQSGAWDAISDGDDCLVVAPTGSGKTLAAFLSALDRLAVEPTPAKKERLRILYVSPLKALAVDIERNLRSPLAGMKAAAQRLGEQIPEIQVGLRTGDTPQDERRRFTTTPPDILITTPESLFLLLTSRAREVMTSIDVVILDEIHAVAGTKRGAHLALSLERLDRLIGRRAQRIGLSATVRPLDEIARFLGGTGSAGVKVVNPPNDKRFELEVIVPVEDLGALGTSDDPSATVEERQSIWPHVEERLLQLIRAHGSTIVFANSRRLSERLCARLNDLAGEEIARAHHGSVAREQRLIIEDDLKAGRIPAVVATSSLELGIDMAAVDLVVQIEAPDSVASGLQRIGRAGHQVGAVSKGVFFPKFRGDLLECAVVAERMGVGAIEAMRYPRNPLDVLAQHIVAAIAMDDWDTSEMLEMVRRAAPFEELPESAYEATLDMLSGLYPSDEFAELRPRITWDRSSGTLSARRGAQRLAVTSGGTIPDRGLFGVFMATEGGGRVGELDEEMVYESRPGETFVLGASTWMIEDITHDRVLVSPAPGRPGKMPFWHGDAPGRPFELGKAQGEFLRTLAASGDLEARERLRNAGLDASASSNLMAYLKEQKDAVGHLPDDRTIVVERFKDELGDWRVVIHSPFGAQVHAPWSQAIEARVRERSGIEVQCIYADDGIVVRVPEADDAPPAESVVFEPDEIEDIVVEAVGSSALFAGRFRESAARALLLPRRRPGGRQPLWQQRQKSSSLLQVARRYAQFPIILETYRECLQDVFDLPALKDLMTSISTREVRIIEVDTQQPSPFASSLLFGFISAFMYEGDSPLAERRAQALSLDRSLLSELLGRDELRELIDDEALSSLELELQRLDDDHKARDSDDLHDLLRIVGDLSREEIRARSKEDPGGWIDELLAAGRVIEVRIAGTDRFIAIEDSARVRDALGVPLPVGLPGAFTEPVSDPLADLIGRFARTHGPFTPDEVAYRLGLGVAVIEGVLERLAAGGRVVAGEFRPDGRPGAIEWVDVEVLRRLRRRSLAAFRKDVEPVPPHALARFGAAWHGVGSDSRGMATIDSVYEAITRLQGAPLPASQLESAILLSRLPGYEPALLDQLMASGEVTWAGAGAAGSDDGWIVLATASDASLLLPEAAETELSDGAQAILDALSGRGASFFRDIAAATNSTDDAELLLSLWELVWAGHVTNDTLAPLRALGGVRSRGARRRRRPSMPSRLGPPAGAGRWSVVETRVADPTRRSLALAEQMLSRHGVVTRGAVVGERIVGGFARVYPVLKLMEDTGKCRRGYFVDGLGGAQFAYPGAVDRMRTLAEVRLDDLKTHVMASADPASPYGAALAWPLSEGLGHRPGRKVGASVVLVNGEITLYVEKGGRTILVYSDDDQILAEATAALSRAVKEGLVGRLHVQKVDGDEAMGSKLERSLLAAGFRPSSRGLRLDA